MLGSRTCILKAKGLVIKEKLVLAKLRKRRGQEEKSLPIAVAVGSGIKVS